MNEYNEKEVKEKVEKLAFEIAKEFNLELNEVRYIRTDFFYGQANKLEKWIQIKVVFYDGELVPLMEVYRTLAHEMAHLRYPNHEKDFWEFNREIANWLTERVGMTVRPEIALFNLRDKANRKVIS